MSSGRYGWRCPPRLKSTFSKPAYLFAVSGDTCLSWMGNTLEETVRDEMTRNERTFQRMKAGACALPYDLSRFDHQPTIDKMIGFQGVTFEQAEAATWWQRSDVVLFEKLLERGFRNATITSPPGLGEQQTCKATGGLMSGLRSTFAVGSCWNAVLGETARDLANRFRGHNRKLDTWQIVKGNDTQVVSDSYLDVLVINKARLWRFGRRSQ